MGVMEENIIGALFEFFFSVLFCFRLLEKNNSTSDKKSFLKYIFIVPVVVASIVFSRYYYSVIILKSIVLVSKTVPVFLFSKATYKDKTVSFLLTEWFWILGEVFAWLIIRINNPSGNLLFHNTLSPAFFSIIAVLFILFIAKPVNKKILVAGFVQIATVVLLIVVRIADKDGVIGFFSSLMCVAVSMSVCIIVMLIIKPTDNNVNGQTTENQKVSEMEYEYYRIAMENEQKIRRMYHDISNHIQTIQALIENGEHEKGIRLMDELNKTYANIRQVAYCDNPVVNIILRTKVEEADKHGIETRITVKDSLANIPIADIDITKVICNLLDNAIRGCIYSESPQPKLVVEVFKRNRYLVVRVLNSCDMKLHIESAEKLQSTKKGDRTGGFGMTIVSLTAKKYHGDFEVNAANGLFTATAIMLLG